MSRKLLLFFIDGIGLGAEDPEENALHGLFAPVTGGLPFVAYAEPREFPGGILIPADAVLGVPGIPQSATGQTSIFTGRNAQALLGHHLSAYPNEVLKNAIMERSMMKTLREMGVDVTAANLYSKEFFADRENSARNRFPVSTLTIMASGVPFRFAEDYRAGKAVFADITNELIKNRGYDISLIDPEKAAANLVSILDGHDFVFFEYFMTDFHGHKRRRKELLRCVEILNRFIAGIWSGVDQSEVSLMVVSDHGNSEDFSTGDHTLNPVPVLMLSRDTEIVAMLRRNVRDITDIYPAVIEYFGG